MGFPGYTEKLSSVRKDTGLREAVITGTGRIDGIKTAVCMMDNRFLMGSMGTATGEKITRCFEFATRKRASHGDIFCSITNMAAGMAAIEFGFRGSCQCIVTACASATNAVGEAFRQVRDGYQDVMMTGGSEKLYIRAWDRRIHFHEGSLRVKHTGQGFHTFR